jgi:MAPEG family protein
MRGLSLLLSCCGVVSSLLFWRMLVPLMPQAPAASSMAVRLGSATAALLPSAFVMAAMIAAQMIGRFAAAALDPLAGHETRFLLTNQRVITNSVEQMVVFVPGFLALAAGATSAMLPGVLALGGTFAFSRITFWFGYLSAPIARAPGMAATSITNISTLLAATWFWLH